MQIVPKNTTNSLGSQSIQRRRSQLLISNSWVVKSQIKSYGLNVEQLITNLAFADL